MSTNEMFAKACNELEQGEVKATWVRPTCLPGVSSCIEGATTKSLGNLMIWHTDIRDEELDCVGWVQYGKSIKSSNEIKELWLEPPRGTFQGICCEAAKCLLAFFEEVKENKSIEYFVLDIAVSLAIPSLDLRYFFENNQKLKEIQIRSSIVSVSPEQSAHISMALRDIPFESLYIKCHSDTFTNNGAFEKILFSCLKVKKLHLSRLKGNYQFTSLAEFIRDPKAICEDLCFEKRYHTPNLDVEMAHSEILSSLTQNTKIKILRCASFRWIEAPRCFENLLCNNSSIENICQSNHSLEQIDFDSPNVQQHCQRYLDINKTTADKRKVVRMKAMQYYLNRHFDASPLPNMPLSVMPRVLGIDYPGEFKCTATYNILKGTPELCDVSSRNLA